jgi:hypothetical protein
MRKNHKKLFPIKKRCPGQGHLTDEAGLMAVVIKPGLPDAILLTQNSNFRYILKLKHLVYMYLYLVVTWYVL